MELMYFHWQACGILTKDPHGSTDKFNINFNHMAKEKLRLDVMLKEKGLVSSRARGQALIMAGSVQVDGVTVTKSGFPVSRTQQIAIIENSCPFVGRGGLKLQRALEAFGVSAASRVCLDVGASTGGFTDCLLQNGAKLVYALDVGYGQLDWTLRQRPDVINIERTNIRHVSQDLFAEIPDLATVDTSFISLKIVIPKVKQLIRQDGEIIALIKPQFEAGREKVGKGGIVRDPEIHREVIRDLEHFFNSRCGMKSMGVIDSPISGAKGNREFLIHLKNEDL